MLRTCLLGTRKNLLHDSCIAVKFLAGGEMARPSCLASIYVQGAHW